MTDQPKKDSKIEQLETEIVGLKVRIARLESFIRNMPNPDDYYQMPMPNIEDPSDTLIESAIGVVRQYDRASASLLQRRLSIGYARASRIMDILTARKIIAPFDGTSKPREVYKKTKQRK